MSLFKRLVKKAIKQGLDEFVDNIRQETKGNLTPVQTTMTHVPSGNTFEDFGGTEEAYFDQLFAKHFSEYTIERKVPASRYDAFCPVSCVPVDYVFEKAGRPCLGIVLVYPNRYKGKTIDGTMDACQNAGFPCIRFFRTWRNEEHYVVDRIKKNMK